MRKEQIPLMERRDSLQRRNQILTVAGVTMALFATGNILGFSSVAIPTLLSKDSEINASVDAMSWIASLVTIGCILGTLVGGLISDQMGRKKTILLSSLIYFVGWALISTDVSELLTGRMLTGIASGFYASTVQVYICEIVEPEIRGVSGSLPTLMVSIGILCVYCMGSVLEWRVVALICSSFPLFVLIYVLFLPESPVWLISKGRQPEALKSLTWLRNDPGIIQLCSKLNLLSGMVYPIMSLCVYRRSRARMYEAPVLKGKKNFKKFFITKLLLANV